ncbi:MAG: M14 family metallopeptidase [Bacteroidales bacterium]|nr:M14 family metallopeptidase [Bacteroidales bacterium]
MSTLSAISFLKKFLTSLLILALVGTQAFAQLPTPKSHIGFEPGTDKMLLTYEQLIDYLKLLEKGSKKINIQEVGQSSMGKPMYVVCISSEANIARLEELKIINRDLAMNRNLSPTEREKLINEGKVFVLVTLSMHSAEVAPSQAAPLIAHELITSTSPDIQAMLDEVVYMMVPCHNPDGMNMIVDHYNKTKNTSLDGSTMPGVYHKYVGHNINRDFLSLSQAENKVVAHLYTKEWFPQVMIEKHQMGSNGPRYFVSPPHDPIAENVDAGIWNWMQVFGSRALTDMTAAGLKGVSVNYLFDDYWPGSTTTAIWKGVIGMLSEAAGVNLASPIYVEPNELRTIGKGMGEYAKSINMPAPWPGGWWRLSDIVEYERVNTLSYLRTAALHKKEILTFRNNFTQTEIKKGKQEAPYFYFLPLRQHDQSELATLINLLDEHNVKTYALNEDMLLENRFWKKGDLVVPLAQPYRSFIKEVMESQVFPARHYTPGGEMIRPYDVTSWSLPLHKGVEAVEIKTDVPAIESRLIANKIPFQLHAEVPPRYSHLLFTANYNESFKAMFMAMAKGMEVQRTTAAFEYEGITYPAGSFLIKEGKHPEELAGKLSVGPTFVMEGTALPETRPMKAPRIALVESWFHPMDAGWLRFLFDQYNIPFTVLRPAELQTADFSKFDVVILTDENKSVLMNGKYGEEGSYSIPRYPPENAKGMEKKGFTNLLTFINNGGKVLAWGGSTDLFMGALSIGGDDKGKEDKNKEEFQLPVRNIGPDLGKKGLVVPGSLLRVSLISNHPLTWGMPASIGVFHRGSPVFMTSIPYFDMDRRVIAFFHETDILMSGYADKNELLAKQAALVWLRKGKGQLVLYSFSPHSRGQMQATYKLLLNGILMP